MRYNILHFGRKSAAPIDDCQYLRQSRADARDLPQAADRFRDAATELRQHVPRGPHDLFRLGIAEQYRGEEGGDVPFGVGARQGVDRQPTIRRRR